MRGVRWGSTRGWVWVGTRGRVLYRVLPGHVYGLPLDVQTPQSPPGPALGVFPGESLGECPGVRRLLLEETGVRRALRAWSAGRTPNTPSRTNIGEISGN